MTLTVEAAAILRRLADALERGERFVTLVEEPPRRRAAP